MKYSNTFLGYFQPKGKTVLFVADLRTILHGSGVGIRIYGRNPNRKRFHFHLPNPRKACWDRGSGRVARDSKGKIIYYQPTHPYSSDLPLKYAKTYAIYFRMNIAKTGNNWERSYTVALKHAHRCAYSMVEKYGRSKLYA
jgi:hypothetical protein